MVGTRKRTKATAAFFADELVRKKKKVGMAKITKRAKTIGVLSRELISDILSELKKKELSEAELNEIEKRFINLTAAEREQILQPIKQETKSQLTTEERNKALIKLTKIVAEDLKNMDPEKSKRIKQLFAEVIDRKLEAREK